MSSPASALLVRASDQLDRKEPHAVRRACWLTRSALEGIVQQLLQARQINLDEASERAKLSCLEGAYHDDRDLVARAEYAWSRLSEACHQHAYELTPTHQEATHLVDLVRRLAARAREHESSPTG